MPYAKLTTKEIEQRIDQFTERTKALGDIIKDIKNIAAKETLQTQINNYKTSLNELRKELAMRNRH